jgi:hypothetical protein
MYVVFLFFLSINPFFISGFFFFFFLLLAADSWAMLGTNLSVKGNDGNWTTETERYRTLVCPLLL